MMLAARKDDLVEIERLKAARATSENDKRNAMAAFRRTLRELVETLDGVGDGLDDIGKSLMGEKK